MNRFINQISVHSKAHQIAICMVIASVLQGLLTQTGSLWLLFSPFRTLFRFEIWRPFTSLFIAISPLEVIFGALIIYSIGGMLESRWRPKRFIAVTLGIPLIAQIVVLILTLIAPDVFASQIYSGSRQVVTTLWIVFGLAAHFSGEMLNFWGAPITGKTFALIGVGFVALSAVFGGILPVLPELITAGLCYIYMFRHRTLRIKNKLELRYYDWKLKKLKNKTKLRVIKGSRDDQNSDGGSGPIIH